MKRSTSVVVPALLALAACGPDRRDPCKPDSWDDKGCRSAIQAHPGMYPGGYDYFWNNYFMWNNGGGYVWSPITGSRTYVAPRGFVGSSPSSLSAEPESSASAVSRGGFGASAGASGGGE